MLLFAPIHPLAFHEQGTIHWSFYVTHLWSVVLQSAFLRSLRYLAIMCVVPVLRRWPLLDYWSIKRSSPKAALVQAVWSGQLTYNGTCEMSRVDRIAIDRDDRCRACVHSLCKERVDGPMRRLTQRPTFGFVEFTSLS